VLDGTEAEASEPEYHVSSFSGGGDCVAVARLRDGGYAVRHSRDPVVPIIFSCGEWKAFVAGVKAAEFDF
jgi:Domain of unknown function (DUF397)